MEKRYLGYKGFEVTAGISHQKSNLAAMLREAFLCNRSLVVPNFRLERRHNLNRGRITRMAEYFDYPNVQVGNAYVELRLAPVETDSLLEIPIGQRCPVEDTEVVIKNLSKCPLLRPVFEKIYGNFASIPVTIPTHPDIVTLASRVLETIPPRSVWVHVRRGDKARETSIATSPEAIQRALERFAPGTETIYIATDEKNADHFSPLRKHYNLLLFGDFREFTNLKQLDNYQLYLAEQEFGKRFPIRISTFKTTSGLYHGSLSDSRGFQ